MGQLLRSTFYATALPISWFAAITWYIYYTTIN